MENGFLLLAMQRILYDHVSYNQLTKSKWIQQNSLDPQSVQQLLDQFYQNIDVSKLTPVLNLQQQNGIVPATGQPYYKQICI